MVWGALQSRSQTKASKTSNCLAKKKANQSWIALNVKLNVPEISVLQTWDSATTPTERSIMQIHAKLSRRVQSQKVTMQMAGELFALTMS